MERGRGLFASDVPLQWLPDETLFSWCSRYHRLSGNYLAATTCKALFGHARQGCAHDLPSRVSHFSRITGGLLGTAEEIVRGRTMLPFYLPFAAPETAVAAIEAMSGPSIGSLKFQLGLLTSRFRANHPLKACPSCMAEDRSRAATAYWHREHQWPAVWICRRHRVWLATSDLKSTGVGRFQWTLPDERHLSIRSDSDGIEGPVAALADAATSLAALDASVHLAPQAVKRALRGALRSRGLMAGDGAERLNLRAIGLEYGAFVRALHVVPALRALPTTADGAAAEVGRLTYGRQSGAHVIRYLALVAWLFPTFDRFVEAFEAPVPPEATQSEDAEATSEHSGQPSNPRRQALLDLLTSGSSPSGAARKLGVDPATAMAWAATAGIATKGRPQLLRGEARAQTIAALRTGASKLDAASVAKVSVEIITKLLRTEIGLRDDWRSAQLAQARRRARNLWLQVIADNPLLGAKAVRLLEPAASAWPYRNDKQWLDGQVSRLSRAESKGGSTVDWDSRDLTLAAEVQRVGAALAADVPGTRLKLWQLYQRIPELKAKLARLDRLPLTRAAIQSLTRAQQGGGLL